MDASPIAKLSAELRNEIYSLALYDDEPRNLLTDHPPLLQTCRQIRNECHLVYYALNTFTMTITGDTQGQDSQSTALRFVRKIDQLNQKKLQHIRTLNVTYEALFQPSAHVSEWHVHKRRAELVCDALAAKGLRREQVVWDVGAKIMHEGRRGVRRRSSRMHLYRGKLRWALLWMWACVARKSAVGGQG